MKVKDIFLLNKDFRDFKVLAGESGLDNLIKSVEIMEVPDGIYWANEGDFMITTGYCASKGDISLEYIVNHLISRNSAALCIKLGRFINEIPIHILELADRHSLPIIYLPPHLSYSDILKPLMEAMSTDEEQYILEYQYNLFEKQLKALKNEKFNLNDLKLLLENHLKYKTCIILEEEIKGEINSHEFPETITNNLISNLKQKSLHFFHTHINDEEYTIFTITNSHIENLGYLIVLSNYDLTNTEFKIIQRLISEFSISILSEIIYGKARYIGKEKFYFDTLKGKYLHNELDYEENQLYFKIEQFLNRRVLILKHSISDNNVSNGNIISIIESNLLSINCRLEFNFYSENEIIMIIESDDTIEDSIINNRMLHALNTIEGIVGHNRLKIGFSKYCKNFKKIPYAFDEAYFSITIGEKLNPKDNIYFYNDYVVYHLFYNLRNQNSINIIYKNTIERLIEYDKANNADLLATLKTYSDCDYTIIDASKALFIHRNTLYKRISKINEILDIDLEKNDDRIMIQIALKLHDIKD